MLRRQYESRNQHRSGRYGRCSQSARRHTGHFGFGRHEQELEGQERPAPGKDHLDPLHASGASQPRSPPRSCTRATWSPSPANSPSRPPSRTRTASGSQRSKLGATRSRSSRTRASTAMKMPPRRPRPPRRPPHRPPRSRTSPSPSATTAHRSSRHSSQPRGPPPGCGHHLYSKPPSPIERDFVCRSRKSQAA